MDRSVEPANEILFELRSVQKPLVRVKQIWAVGGGKGGVGKSLISSNLAIALARLGNKVVAIDLDLGGANLHTALGVDSPKQTLSDFFSNRTQKIEDCLVPSGVPNLDLISGAQDSVGVANLSEEEKNRFLQTVRSIPADFVVFDLGAGTSLNTLDFFLHSDVGFLTMLPEPTSIENVYRFVKSAYYRRLETCPQLESIRELVQMAMDGKNPRGIKSPSDLYREVNRVNPEAGLALKNEIKNFAPRLIINQARTQADVALGASVKMVCKKYFGFDLQYVGHLDYDSLVWQAVRRKRPLSLEFPNSSLVANLEKIVRDVMKNNGHS